VPTVVDAPHALEEPPPPPSLRTLVVTGHRFFGALGDGENVCVASAYHEPLGHGDAEAESLYRVDLVIEAWTCGHGDILKTSKRSFDLKSVPRRVGKLRRCPWCKDPAEADPPMLDVLHTYGLFLDR